MKRLKNLILEEADVIINYDTADELEPREDAWAGGENLSLDIDHSAAVKSDPVTASQEVLSITDDRGVYRMSEFKLRKMIRDILK